VPRDLKPEELTVEQAVSLLAERAAKGGKTPRPVRARAKKPPVAANDSGETPQPPKKKTAAKRKAAKPKAKSEAPRRTGTDG
jgi:DNA topoisomerase-1